MLLDGLHIPLTTPFYPDGRVYLRKLEHNVERYSRTPASGLAILTRTGESSLVSEDEAREVFRTAIGASAPEKVMLADISRDGVATTLDLAEFVATLGYDIALLRMPQLLATQSVDAKSRAIYFQAVADRSPLPILLEDDPALSPDLLSELSANPAFVGLVLREGDADRLEQAKAATSQSTREVTVTHVFAAVTRRMQTPRESAASGNYIAAGSLAGGATALATAPPAPALRTRTKKVGFQVLTGTTSTLLAGLESGASGAMLPFAACAPQAVYEVLAAWKDGDPRLAGEKAGRLLKAVAEIENRLSVAGIKAACDLNGYYGGKPRLPLLPLSGDQRLLVGTLMSGMRN